MACQMPMPNDLMTILVCNIGLDYRQVVAEYLQPGGAEHLKSIAADYVRTIASIQPPHQEGSLPPKEAQ